MTVEKVEVKDESRLGREFHYNPSLDALRGIAVMMVILYHLGIFMEGFTPLIKGGFLGVDVFFVLSGFLITSVLLKEHAITGTISLRNFYHRRIYRLVPAYWLFLGLLLFLGWWILPASQVAIIYRGNKFLYAFAYLTNWNSAYGETAGNLNHTWSLAIEEQFYILWPLSLVLALSRGWRPRTMAISTFVIIAVIIIVRFLRANAGTTTQVLYYSTESRLDSLLIGCLASLVFTWRLIPQRFLEGTGFSILATVAAMTSVLIMASNGEKDIEIYRFYLPLFALSVAIVILWLSTNSSSAFNWFFGNTALRWIGKISYGLYLWHYLAFELSRELFNNSMAQIAFGLFSAFGIATTSYYLLELRFLKLKKRLEIS